MTALGLLLLAVAPVLAFLSFAATILLVIALSRKAARWIGAAGVKELEALKTGWRPLAIPRIKFGCWLIELSARVSTAGVAIGHWGAGCLERVMWWLGRIG